MQTTRKDIQDILDFFETGKVPKGVKGLSNLPKFIRPRVIEMNGEKYSIDAVCIGRLPRWLLLLSLPRVIILVVSRQASLGRVVRNILFGIYTVFVNLKYKEDEEEVAPWRNLKSAEELESVGNLAITFRSGLSFRDNLMEMVDAVGQPFEYNGEPTEIIRRAMAEWANEAREKRLDSTNNE